MTDPSVDQLRQQLRDLGYLTHGIERWFALDPWSSRTFWAELLAVSAKASLVSSIFAALPLLAITILRNRPLALGDALVIGGIQAAGAFATPPIKALYHCTIAAGVEKIAPAEPIELQ